MVDIQTMWWCGGGHRVGKGERAAPGGILYTRKKREKAGRYENKKKNRRVFGVFSFSSSDKMHRCIVPPIFHSTIQ